MELNLVIRQRNRCTVLILGLQQVFHLQVGLGDPIANAQSVIADLDVEDSDRVRRKDNLHLVKLHGGVFVDGDEDPLVVPSLGTVDEGAELRNPASALEISKVVRLLGEREGKPFPVKGVSKKGALRTYPSRKSPLLVSTLHRVHGAIDECIVALDLFLEELLPL